MGRESSSGVKVWWILNWPQIAAVAAICAVTVSLASMAWLHVVAGVEPSPIANTVSSYVHLIGGGELFAVGALSLAVGAGTLAVGLSALGVRFDRITHALVIVWMLSLLLTVCFPAEPPGRLSPTGLAHAWAGGLVFVCLPLAGWRMSGVLVAETAWHGVVHATRRLVIGSWVSLLLFLLTHPHVNEWYGGAAMHGLFERVLLGLQVGLLLTLSTGLLRVGRLTSATLRRPVALRMSGAHASAGGAELGREMDGVGAAR